MARQTHPRTPAPGGATLAELAALVGGTVSGGAGEARVIGVQQDSRRIEPGDLFAALRGERSDGAAFVEAAAKQGAAAVLRDAAHPIASALPVLYVDTPRRALAQAAARVYGHPTDALSVIGITGTNGKTTTAHLVAASLRGTGRRPGVVGTLGSRFEDLALPGALTSPEADELARIAAAMRARGASHLVMEVSSIAIEAERIAGVRFEVAVFTNLTQDHLDYHGTMERYAAAKERLFFEHAPATAVVQVDDPFGSALAERVERAGRSRVVRVSASPERGGELLARGVPVVFTERPAWRSDKGISVPVVTSGGGRVEVHTPLSGWHNADNVLCALAVVESLGLELEAAAEALASVEQVPGRLERVSAPGRDELHAYVDYAHTPGALERVLESLRSEHPESRIWCVFGCGGDRDAAKRGPMGQVVGRLCDRAIVTNDNPRSEDPELIAGAIVEGLNRAGAADHVLELDRRAAIERAVTEAAPGDVVIVAGKGHETYQILGACVIDFDDRVVVAEALARRRATGSGG